jgi:orotidine-5'-phosphate decarboxylase
MAFHDTLRDFQRSQQSLLCIGLDTDQAKLPGTLSGRPDAVLEFNRQIIEATHDLVCAYKINLAFYELLGEQCWSLVRETLALIPEGIITIGDGKRGDIGNTSAYYARALREGYGFMASTVNPYMGTDAVGPFLQDPDHGVFILALTSNAGARDFQHLRTRTGPLYEVVVRKARGWNTRGNCGLVVGATRPHQLRRIRQLAPSMPILVPGIGAQGGDLRRAVRYGCDRYGEMGIFTASRSVLYASSGADYASKARAAALALRDEINTLRGLR